MGYHWAMELSSNLPLLFMITFSQTTFANICHKHVKFENSNKKIILLYMPTIMCIEGKQWHRMVW